MRAAVRRVIRVGLIAGIAAVASAQDSPPIARYVPSAPDPAHVFVLDSAHLLSPHTLQTLQDSARALQTETAADVAWITLPTLGGRPIEEAALYIGRTWRIGSAGQPGDPLRNRGLVILFIPDKTKTAGSNFRVEVGNGLEGTITDSRSRAISLAMREELRAKHYDAAYMAGWGVAAALVRTDFASHGDGAQTAALAAAAAAAAARPAPVVRGARALARESDRAGPFPDLHRRPVDPPHSLPAARDRRACTCDRVSGARSRGRRRGGAPPQHLVLVQ